MKNTNKSNSRHVRDVCIRDVCVTNPAERERISVRVSRNTIIINFLLTLAKLLTGIMAGSAAMISDAVDSGADMISTFVVIVGVKIASKRADDDHPYGHERFEAVAAMILAVMLFVTGAGVAVLSVLHAIDIINGKGEKASDGFIIAALIAAFVTIVVKEGMYHYKKRAARKIDSAVLLADAWHHRSDAISSVATLIGIAGMLLGAPILDPIAGGVTCLFIFWAAFGIFRDAVRRMTDHACPVDTIDEARLIIAGIDGVISVDEVLSRLFGDKIYMDVEIGVNGALPLTEAHGIADAVHDALEAKFPKLKHCMVHVNPVIL